MAELFGQLISVWDVQQAAIAALKEWMPVYLAAVERQHGLPRRALGRPDPKVGYYPALDYLSAGPSVPAPPSPPVVIVTAQPKGEPELNARGYVQCFALGVGCVVEGATEEEALFRASLFGAASMMLAQISSLGGLAERVVMSEAPRIEFVDPNMAERRLMRSVCVFDAYVSNIVEQLGPGGERIPASWEIPPWEVEGIPAELPRVLLQPPGVANLIPTPTFAGGLHGWKTSVEYGATSSAQPSSAWHGPNTIESAEWHVTLTSAEYSTANLALGWPEPQGLIPVEAGKAYTLSANIDGLPFGNVPLRTVLYFFSRSGSKLGEQAVLTSTSGRISLTEMAPEGSAYAGVRFYLQQHFASKIEAVSGVVFVDEVCLVAGSEAPYADGTMEHFEWLGEPFNARTYFLGYPFVSVKYQEEA